MHALLAASIGTLAPAFFALLSLVAPPRVRAAGLTTIAVFAVPGIAIFLPLIGAISDAHGIQPSMLLSRADRGDGRLHPLHRRPSFVLPDIAASHAESLARARARSTA